MSEILDAAMIYADLGLAVIPLKGKVPMFQNWPEIATKDHAMIQRWWSQNPTANVGIATGVKSNVFVVDIDPRHGGQLSWETLLIEHAGVPDTWQDLTGGGGKHVFFRYPNFAVKNCVGILPGVDIRGDGGQVVAPPSIHPETHRAYAWDGLEPITKQPLAEAPQWLLEILAPTPAPKRQISEIPFRIPHGVQHHALVSLAGYMRRIGLNFNEILLTLLEVNEHRCEQPGPRVNIEKIAKSVMRYQPGDADLYTMAAKLWKLTRAAEHRKEEQLEALKPVDAYALIKKPPVESQMVIEDCLHPGCTILAGPPKCGKSWLVLGMAIAVATGGKFIGARDILKPGRVGYWALEESDRRTHSRLSSLIEVPIISLQNLEFMYALKPMFGGGLADIAAYCEQSKPDMIVIDTLMAFVTGDRGSRRDVFRDDYREIKALSDLALKYGTALVVVHHTNKLGGGGIEAVAGTGGVTAAADCIWIMMRQPDRRALLEIQGREIENQSFLMELDIRNQIGWHVLEQGDDVALSGERQIILEVLREGGPKAPKQLALEIGKTPVATRQLLFKMAKRGLIVKHQNGNYVIATEANKHWNERDE